MYGSKGSIQEPPCVDDIVVKTIRSIQLFTTTNTVHVLTTNMEFVRFLKRCHAHKEKTVFKTFHGIHSRQNFQNEYQAFIRLYNVLTPQELHTFTALKTLPYGKMKAVGFSVEDAQTIKYYIINERGANTLQELICKDAIDVHVFEQCIKDLLSAVITLYRCRIIHGDIKPSNIMYFKESARFKLIDWEHMRMVGDFKKYGCHPIYFDTLHLFDAHIIKHYVKNVMCPLSKEEQNDFYIFMKRSWESYSALKKKVDNAQRLRDSLSGCIDTYAIGLIMYSMCKRLKLHKDIKNVIERLCIFSPGVIICPLDAFNMCCKTFIGGSPTSGKHGVVYNLNVLCISSVTIDIMQLIGEDFIEVHTDTSQEPLGVNYKDFNEHFMKVIKRDANHVVKAFKKPSIVSSVFGYGNNDFKVELSNLRLLRDIYKGNEDMIALPTLRYKNNVVYGICCNNNHMILNKKGNYSIVHSVFSKDTLRVLFQNLYTSLHVLHNKQFIHRDVKPENIVHFDGGYKYRLVDWQKMVSVAEYDPSISYHGSSRTGSPIGFFFSAKKHDALYFVEKSDMHEFQVLRQHVKFMKHYHAAISLFQDVFKQTKISIHDVFHQWRYNIDLFSMGITILYIMYNNNIKDNVVEKLAYRLLTAKSTSDIDIRCIYV